MSHVLSFTVYPHGPMAPPSQAYTCHCQLNSLVDGHSIESGLHPRNGWGRDSTNMGQRYIVRRFNDQRGYYLLCNMVTPQSLRSFSLGIDKSNPINRCHCTAATEPYLVTVLGTHLWAVTVT
jgi:hypothetical protein